MAAAAANTQTCRPDQSPGEMQGEKDGQEDGDAGESLITKSRQTLGAVAELGRQMKASQRVGSGRGQSIAERATQSPGLACEFGRAWPQLRERGSRKAGCNEDAVPGIYFGPG